MSGFPQYTGDQALVVTTRRPRTPQVTDEYGNPLIYGTTDNANSNFPIDERVVEFVEYGLLNASFARGPIDPNHDITDINALPDWTGPTSASGGAITAQWVADSNSPSGQNLRFTVNAGAASDEAYFDQIIPIGGSRARWIGASGRLAGTCVATSGSGMVVTLSMTGLTANLSVLSSIGSGTATITGAGDFNLTTFAAPNTPQATVRYLRIRIDLNRSGAAATDTATIDISDVRLDLAHAVTILAETTTPASYSPGLLYQAGGTVTLWPDRGSSFTRILAASSGDIQLQADTSHTVQLVNGRLTFPASQNASSDANTLDDYAEGTWTPVLQYATVGSSSWAVTTQTGYYTKIGRQVTVSFTYQGVPTNGTASGNLQITGWPFTSFSSATPGFSFTTQMQGWTKASYTQATVALGSSSTTANVVLAGSGQALATAAVGDIPSAGTVLIRATGSYFV